MTFDPSSHAFFKSTEKLGRLSFASIETFGHWGVLIGESLYWLVAGPKLKQPVRLKAITQQMMEIGIFASSLLTGPSTVGELLLPPSSRHAPILPNARYA